MQLGVQLQNPFQQINIVDLDIDVEFGVCEEFSAQFWNFGACYKLVHLQVVSAAQVSQREENSLVEIDAQNLAEERQRELNNI